MTNEYATKIQKVKNAMDNRYEEKANKRTDISGDFTENTTAFPTVQAVKTYIEGKGYITEHQSISGKLDIAQTSHKGKNVVVDSTSGDITFEDKPTIPTKTSNLTNDGSNSSDSLVFIETSATAGLVKNDGTIDTTTYISDVSDKEDSSNKVTSWTSTTTDTHYPSEKLVKTELDKKISKSDTAGLVKNDGSIDTNTYLTQHQDISNYVQKSNTAGLIKNDGTIDTSSYLTEHQSLDSKTVTVTKQTTAETGYAATYVIAQGGTDLSTKINIPKDFLVKSGQVKTAASADLTTLGNGYEVGDKYIDFVVNTKDGSGTDEHIYINVKDLVEDTTYTADESTLQLSNGQFSIKSSGVDTTQIKDAAVTSDKIASAVKNSWLTTSDVDTEADSRINAALDALAEAIYPTTQQN